jgi:hypothetical protein
MHMVDLRQTKQCHVHNLLRQTREKDLHHLLRQTREKDLHHHHLFQPLKKIKITVIRRLTWLYNHCKNSHDIMIGKGQYKTYRLPWQ